MSLDERLARYVEQELAVRLGLGGRLTGVPVERLAAGKVEHLRRVDVPGFGRVILRAFYRKAHRRRPAGRARLTELLTQGGIRVPRVLFVDDSARTRRDCGFAILAEEFLDGLPPTGLPPERHAGVLDAATDILLRLHAIRSRTAGKPWEGDGWRPADRARTLLAAWLRPLAALPVGLEPGQAGRLEAWVPPALDALQAPPYPLVHGDIHPGNLLLGAGGELCLLDLGAMAFGIPHLDLFLAETALCRGDAGLRQRMLERYFAANSGLTLRAYEAGRALVAAWHALGKAGVAARRALKKEARGQPASALREKSAHFWSLARQSLAEAGAPQVRSGE